MRQSSAAPGDRVAAGLRTFSTGDPQWWCEGGENEINPDTLNMSDPRAGILAQRFGSLEAGLERLGLTEAEGIACGFIAIDDEDAVMLRRLWLVNLFSSRAEARAWPPLEPPASPAGGGGSPGRWYL